MASFVQLSATAAPGHPLAELHHAIEAELAKLAEEGPTDVEIERGRVQAETQFVQRLQTVGGFGGKSDQLNAYNTYLGRPDYFSEDLARYARVTSESLRRTVKRYLVDAHFVALSVVPHGRPELAIPDSVAVAVS